MDWGEEKMTREAPWTLLKVIDNMAHPISCLRLFTLYYVKVREELSCPLFLLWWDKKV